MMLSEKKNNRLDLSVYAYEEISKLIFDNQFKPGEILYEKQLAEVLEMSRTPVREALSKLNADGLVDILPGRGTIVRKLTREDLDEIYELRMCFELFVAEQCMEELPEFKINKMDEMLHNSLDILNNGGKLESKDMISLDNEFHNIFFSTHSNSRLHHIYNIVDRQDLRCRLIAVNGYNYKLTIEEHLDLLEIVRNRDFNMYKKELTGHILEAKDFVIKALNL